MSFSFRAQVWKWPGDMGWHFVNVPKEDYITIREKYGKGLKRAKVTVGRSVWMTSLLPHNASGTYLIALKASIRKMEGLFEGDEVRMHVELLQ